jgi:hypothetical protein
VFDGLEKFADRARSRPNHGSERSPVKSGNCSEKLEARVGIEPLALQWNL